jgi:hypothetical protein
MNGYSNIILRELICKWYNEVHYKAELGLGKRRGGGGGGGGGGRDSSIILSKCSRLEPKTKKQTACKQIPQQKRKRKLTKEKKNMGKRPKNLEERKKERKKTMFFFRIQNSKYIRKGKAKKKNQLRYPKHLPP